MLLNFDPLYTYMLARKISQVMKKEIENEVEIAKYWPYSSVSSTSLEARRF